MPRPVKPRAPSRFLFLLGLVPSQTLECAERIAPRWGAEPHHVLIDLGYVSAEAYTAALADVLDVPVIEPPGAVWHGGGRLFDGHVLVCAVDRGPDDVAALIAQARQRGVAIALTSRPPPTRGEREDPESIVASATHGLAMAHPHLSAVRTVTLGQMMALTVLAGLVIGGGMIDPGIVMAGCLAALSLPFVFVIALRSAALVQIMSRGGPRPPPYSPDIPDDELPVYSILVPLYREALMVPDLVRAFDLFDYPPDKLDIVFAVEEEDAATQEAIASLALPPWYRMIVVPPGRPRTKPRALNVALAHARGAFVTVYDAEDHPEPDQLRRALAALRARPERIGCAQARLAIDNTGRGWLPRQFAIEYAALFDAILPMLERTGLPVPLGGTSNHFPRRLLMHIGGWDPYNVTEDADLGIRLARMGWHVTVIASTTWEEAPRRWGVWLRQRTRWLKGWMQTVLVHNRHPVRLMRELGEARFLGFQALMAGLILAALAHPWIYILFAWGIASGQFLELPQALIGQPFWGLAWFNLVGGFVVSMLLGLVAAVRRGRWRLGLSVVLLPLYWIAISIAAHRALLQLISDPHRWEKTPHTPRSRRMRGRGRARARQAR